MADESTHEDENGIRHKKGPKLFKDIFMPMISGGVGGSAFGPIGAAVGAGLGGLQGFGSYQNRVHTNSQLGSGESQMPSSGSYAPTTGMNNVFGSPLSLFGGGAPTSGSYAPSLPTSSGTTGSIGLGQGAFGNELSHVLLQKLKAGNYSGRLTF